jgi:sortase A
MLNRREMLAAAIVTGLAACSNGRSATTLPTSLPTGAPTMPRTTAVTTTRATSTTTTTTAPPTTTTEPLPVPAPAPDPRANEPRIEIGSIAIPKIEVAKSMYEGVSLNTLDIGPGHWPGTAMPGQRGNVVVAGHRTSHDKPFRHLDLLVPGDQVVMGTLAGSFTYVVSSTEIVTPDAIRIIEQTDAYTATLFACHPVGSTKERIVVHLTLAP